MGRIVFIILALLIVPIAIADLQVQHPDRSYGYFIGDVLLQRVNLESSAGAVSATDLESGLRINDYLYRLPNKTVTIQKQQWLELRYQVINSPTQTETIALPAITFVTESGEEQLLQPWFFTVAPLTASGDGDVSSPLPDRSALDVIDKPNMPLLKMGMISLLSVLGLWFLWWLIRHVKDSHTLPFALARRTINKLPSAERDKNPQAWIALHRAFNDVAGKTISGNSLDQLYSAAPWIKQYEGKVEEFYTASSVRFFQQVEPEAIAVSKLCNTLHQAEKRQAKQVAKASAGMVD